MLDALKSEVEGEGEKEKKHMCHCENETDTLDESITELKRISDEMSKDLGDTDIEKTSSCPGRRLQQKLGASLSISGASLSIRLEDSPRERPVETAGGFDDARQEPTDDELLATRTLAVYSALMYSHARLYHKTCDLYESMKWNGVEADTVIYCSPHGSQHSCQNDAECGPSQRCVIFDRTA